jgi:hypothetical protein
MTPGSKKATAADRRLRKQDVDLRAGIGTSNIRKVIDAQAAVRRRAP